MTNSSVVNAPNPGIDGNPEVTALSGGRAAFAYQSREAGGAFEIMLRLREADKTFGPEIPIEGGWSRARNPELTTLSDGSVLVSWLAQTSPGGNFRTNVLAQRFDDKGAPLSGVFTVASQPVAEGRWLGSRIEADPEGGFIAQVWADDPEFRSAVESYRFDTNADTDPTFLNTEATVPLSVPKIFTLAGTRALAQHPNGSVFYEYARGSYYSDDYDFYDFDVVISNENFQAYYLSEDTALLLVREPISINDFPGYLVGYQDSFDLSIYYPASASYSSLHAYTVTTEIRGRGVAIEFGPAIALYEDRAMGAADSYAATALDGGGFVATWSEDGDIWAQVVGADDRQIGGNFVVADGPAPQVLSSVAQLDNGALVFAWQEKRGEDVDVRTRTVSLEEASAGTFETKPIPSFYVDAYLDSSGGDYFEARVGETLTVSGRVDSNVDLRKLELQWLRQEGDDWVAIEGANGRRFRPTEAEVGFKVSIGATMTFEGGVEYERVLEDGFGDGSINILASLDGAVTLEGVATVGNVLVADPQLGERIGIDTDLAAEVTYRWFRDGEAIEGATDGTYRLVAEDEGAEILAHAEIGDSFREPSLQTSRGIEIAAAPAESEEWIRGSGRDEMLSGSAGDDTVVGFGGDDTLGGGLGADVLAGAFGSDTYIVDDAEDFVYERAAWSGTDKVIALVDYDMTRAGYGLDGSHVEEVVLRGDAVSATGDARANRLEGNPGDNVLDGGGGADTLIGGTGADDFVIRQAPGPGEAIRILDFQSFYGDRLLIGASLVPGADPGVLSADLFHAGTEATEAAHRIVFTQRTGEVLLDPDGAGGEDGTVIVNFGSFAVREDLSADDIFLF